MKLKIGNPEKNWKQPKHIARVKGSRPKNSKAPLADSFVIKTTDVIKRTNKSLGNETFREEPIIKELKVKKPRLKEQDDYIKEQFIKKKELSDMPIALMDKDKLPIQNQSILYEEEEE